MLLPFRPRSGNPTHPPALHPPRRCPRHLCACCADGPAQRQSDQPPPRATPACGINWRDRGCQQAEAAPTIALLASTDHYTCVGGSQAAALPASTGAHKPAAQCLGHLCHGHPRPCLLCPSGIVCSGEQGHVGCAPKPIDAIQTSPLSWLPLQARSWAKSASCGQLPVARCSQTRCRLCRKRCCTRTSCQTNCKNWSRQSWPQPPRLTTGSVV